MTAFSSVSCYWGLGRVEYFWWMQETATCSLHHDPVTLFSSVTHKGKRTAFVSVSLPPPLALPACVGGRVWLASPWRTPVETEGRGGGRSVPGGPPPRGGPHRRGRSARRSRACSPVHAARDRLGAPRGAALGDCAWPGGTSGTSAGARSALDLGTCPGARKALPPSCLQLYRGDSCSEPGPVWLPPARGSGRDHRARGLACPGSSPPPTG